MNLFRFVHNCGYLCCLFLSLVLKASAVKTKRLQLQRNILKFKLPKVQQQNGALNLQTVKLCRWMLTPQKPESVINSETQSSWPQTFGHVFDRPVWAEKTCSGSQSGCCCWTLLLLLLLLLFSLLLLLLLWSPWMRQTNRVHPEPTQDIFTPSSFSSSRKVKRFGKTTSSKHETLVSGG